MSNAKADQLLSTMQKKFGDDQIMRASDIPVGDPINTGVLGLNAAVGFGGFPSNRVVELYGREGTGKTTLALLTLRNALAHYPDRCGLYIDMEHKLDKHWLRTLVGEEIFDANRLLYVQVPHIERATNVYREAAQSGIVACAVLDSIGGAPTVRSNVDAEVARVGGNAIGVGEFARAAMTHSSIYNCLTIGINQVREKMGMGFSDDTPGGRAWRHHCCLRVELTKGRDRQMIKPPGEEKEYPIGYTIFAKVRKNGVGAEGRVAKYWFFNVETPEWGFGVNFADEIARLGVVTGVFAKTGSWLHNSAFPVYKDSGEHKINGTEAVKELVRRDEKVRESLSKQIMAVLNEHVDEVAPMSEPEEAAPLVGFEALMNSER